MHTSDKEKMMRPQRMEMDECIVKICFRMNVVKKAKKIKKEWHLPPNL
jgi:hypothetical protein